MYPYYYRRQPDRLDQMLLSRRNLFVALADGRTAVLSATLSHIAVHVGTWQEIRNGTHVRVGYLPPTGYRENGWDLNEVLDLLEVAGMAVKLDLRAFPRGQDGRLAVEEGADFVTLRDQNGNATLRTVPRFGRDIREQIWAFVADNPEGVTVGDIAKAVDRKKSPWLYGKVQSMVDDEYLFKVEIQYRSNMPAYLYYVKQ